MKASKRLRELDEATKDLLPTLNYYIGPGARTAVSRESVQMYYATKAARNTLPLIADVVEAAEAPTLFDYDNVGKESAERLLASLTALRDALEEK